MQNIQEKAHSSGSFASIQSALTSSGLSSDTQDCTGRGPEVIVIIDNQVEDRTGTC